MTPQQWGQFVDTPHTPYFQSWANCLLFPSSFFKKSQGFSLFSDLHVFLYRGKEGNLLGAGICTKTFDFAVQ